MADDQQPVAVPVPVATISTWDAIKAIIVTIPKVLDIIKRLGAQAQEKSVQDWLQSLDETTKQLENSKSLKERVDAAKKLSDLFARL